MLYSGNKIMGLTQGQNPVTHSLYATDLDNGQLTPPPGSEFRKTDNLLSTDIRIADGGDNRITD